MYALLYFVMSVFFFFFQAEDGIRDLTVTGVQTCALPILAATDWVKVLVRRKRPVLYTSDATAVAADPNSQRSFPSGHASIAFAAATSYLVMAQRERLPHRGRNAALLYVGALGVSVLRVSAGKHFPTDVLGGAALGPGIGWLAAQGHATEP